MSVPTRCHPAVFFLVSWVIGVSAVAETPIWQLEPDLLAGSSGVEAPRDLWRFHSADDPSFAEIGLDDSQWAMADPAALPADWDGLGWFRLRLTVAPPLVGVPLALTVDQSGASEVFVDGVSILANGTVGDDVASTEPFAQLWPHVFSFAGAGEHVIAVRYASPQAERFRAVGRRPGFRFVVQHADPAIAQTRRVASWLSGNMGLFVGVFLAFAMLHLLLFAFHREVRENLAFALMCLDCAVLVYCLLRRHQVTDPRFWLVSELAMNVTGTLLGVFALRFVYGVFHDRIPRVFYYLVLPVAAALVVAGLVWPVTAVTAIFLFMLASSAEMIRSVIVALVRRRPGARLVGFGVAALASGFGVGLLANLGVLPRSPLNNFLLPFLSMLVLVASMSVYLSYTFAQTNRALRTQLVRVQELSEERLSQERRLREEEVKRELLLAENARKDAELEEARHLQLSMLPKQVPTLPDLEIAAFMETATEVGGDYYDFDLGADGSLVVAIGDATGHGLRAGTMVTATKSLFQALGADRDLPTTLRRSGVALKRMNLRRLSMALTLARFESGRLEIAAAGMPPAFIYRSETGTVESLLLGGMPLGSLAGFPYQSTSVPLSPGDTVLLMSDGFPERRNVDDDLIGYERAQEAFAEAATEPPQAVIRHLVDLSATWAGEIPADDDVTFVVVRVRDDVAAG